MTSAVDTQADLAYRYRDAVYLNLTDRCPTSCVFCIKGPWAGLYRGWDLRLKGKEPRAQEILAAMEGLSKKKRFSEIVFCGFGEPTYRLPALLDVGRRAKTLYPKTRLRLNTIGLGSLIWGRDIVPELATVIDSVSVSLNTSDPDAWVKIHRPAPPFRKEGFAAVLDFINSCSLAGIDTTLTTVKGFPGPLSGLEAIARSFGVKLRVRPPLPKKLAQA